MHRLSRDIFRKRVWALDVLCKDPAGTGASALKGRRVMDDEKRRKEERQKEKFRKRLLKKTASWEVRRVRRETESPVRSSALPVAHVRFHC